MSMSRRRNSRARRRRADQRQRHPRAVCAWAQGGAGAGAVLPAGKEIRLWNTGQTWKLFDLGMESVERYGFPYITFHRGDLHGVIAQAVMQAKPDAIHLDRKCVGVTQTADASSSSSRAASRRRATLVDRRRRRAFGGARSLFGAAKPEFCGIVAWRGMVPMRARAAGDRAGTSAPTGSARAATSCIIRCAPASCSISSACASATIGPVEGWNVRGTTEESAQRFPRLACRHPRLHPQHRRAVQMGAVRCGRRWRHGPRAASRCSATPATRWCRCWRKAR